MCMEFNRKNIAGKLSQPGDNTDYQEESDNDIEDDDEVYMEQNLTDVSWNNTNVTEIDNKHFH